MNTCGLKQNSDGTWSAWIFSQRMSGTEQQCRAWLRANGEQF
jgi:hypothetical protein